MAGNGLKGYTIVHHVEDGQVVESGIFGPDDKLPDWAQVAVNGDAGEVEDGPQGWDAKNKGELEAEVERRNADRAEADQISVEGTGKNGAVVKGDLVKALEADDARQADAAGAGGEGGATS